MRYVIAVDGGGTWTRAAIADETGYVCGFGNAGPSNYDDVGVEIARNNTLTAVTEACTDARLDNVSFSSIFLGMAGVVSEVDRDVIRRIATNISLTNDAIVGVDHDCRIALAGALSGRPGIVIIAGTGSSVYGRNQDDTDWRSGGWGHLISDEGSGYWLGLQAMRLAVMDYDGRIEAPTITARVMDHLKISDMNDLMHRIYAPPITRSMVATLAPIIIQLAREGDMHAEFVIQEGARSLTKCVVAVARKLNMSAAEIAFVGGLSAAGETTLSPLRASLLEQLSCSRLVPAEMPPLIGAVLLALIQLHTEVPSPVLHTLRTCLDERSSDW